MTIKILTVRQPWAWAIIHGGKDVENRSRNIAGDYRGPVAIHAGLRLAPCRRRGHLTGGDVDFERDLSGFLGRSPRFAWPYRIPEHLGRIIGVVDLVDVHHSDNCWEPYNDQHCSPWAQDGDGAGMHHLVLANPRPLPEPIPYKGALGLRTLPDEVEALIRAQLEER